jgi:MFS family permease
LSPQTTDSAARQPSRQAASLALIFVIVFIDLLGFAIVLPLLPRYAEHLSASPMTIGLLMASFSAMQLLFSPLWGRLSDRIGRKPVLLVGLIGSVIFYTLFGVASIWESLPLMFIARVGAGIAGATIATAQAYIADATDRQHRNRGMALIGAAFGIGFTFGPILGAIALPGSEQLFHTKLNPLPGFIAATISFAAFCIACFKLPETIDRTRPRRPRNLLNLKTLGELLSVPSVVILLGLFFLSTFAFAQFETTLSLLSEKVFHLGDAQNFWLFTYMGVTLSVIQGGIVRRLAMRVRESTLITIGTALIAAGMGLILLAVTTQSWIVLVCVMPVAICGFCFVTPSAQSLISRRSDPSRQGEALGLSQSAAATARILGPLVGNVLFGFGVRLPYLFAVGVLAPAFLMSLAAAKRGRDWPAATLPGIEP